MISFIMNHHQITLDAPPFAIALDIFRQDLHLTGIKEGCREGDCGACTILLGQLKNNTMIYQAVNSCLLPAGELSGKHAVTIEGLNQPELNLIQSLMVEEGAVQCGFCTPGIIISLTAYLMNASCIMPEEAISAIAGNICRCTGYIAIRRAVHRIIAELKIHPGSNRIKELITHHILPAYFLFVPELMQKILPPSNSTNPSNRSEPAAALPPFFVAGGTDLFVHPPADLPDKNLVFLSDNPDHHRIRINQNYLELGAGVTVEEFQKSSELMLYWPELPSQLEWVSSPQIRNRATIGGNIVNASPIGDLTIILLALQAEIELAEATHHRVLPLRQFYTAYKKLAKTVTECVTLIRFPIPQPNARLNFEKVSRRQHLDIASVNTAAQIIVSNHTILDIHLSAGGIAPIPLYLERTCANLRGKPMHPAHLIEALQIMEKEIAPISDVRGSATYKRRLLRHLVISHFITLFPDQFKSDLITIDQISRFQTSDKPGYPTENPL